MFFSLYICKENEVPSYLWHTEKMVKLSACTYLHEEQRLLSCFTSVHELRLNSFWQVPNTKQNNCFNNILIYIGKYNLNYKLADALNCYA